jgi:hypothetical protein
MPEKKNLITDWYPYERSLLMEMVPPARVERAAHGLGTGQILGLTFNLVSRW